MKEYLKKFTVSYNLISASRQLFNKAYKKHGKSGHTNYHEFQPEIVENITICDKPLAFFLRAILEYGHKTVIEIGAFNGYRLINLKRLLPQIDAYGLDIGPRYKEGFTISGVIFSELKQDFFNRDFSRPIVICHCTLNCINPDDLAIFLGVLHKRKLPIAFAEPVPSFRYDTLLKRSGANYYHPYPKVFKDNGFQLAETDYQESIWHSFSLSAGENTYTNYAIPL